MPTNPISSYVYGYDDDDWGDLLTSYNGKYLSYDTVGNIVFDGYWNYSWEQGRQLSKMYDDNMFTIWSYTYDANGMRTKRTSGSITYTYTYHGSQLTHMTHGSTALHFYYDASGSPLSVTYGGATYYYVLNLQGDVVAILDSSGVQVVGYTYDAWGKPLSTTGSMSSTLGLYNPLRYRGYVYDRETGLYYLQSRYYNPTWGRFINADNNFSNNNLYMYCSNNPANAVDPNGEHWYFLWIDDLYEVIGEKIDEGINGFLASISNITYGRAAQAQSFFDPEGAAELWNSRPFQDVHPSQEMQIFTEFMYNQDFVVDLSVSVSIPKTPVYIKVGGSKVLSANKNIYATYFHVGGGLSTPSVFPVSISYSVGMVSGVTVKENYAGSFFDIGMGALYGVDYCWYASSAFSFTMSNAYGVYGGYDYYWCID